MSFLNPLFLLCTFFCALPLIIHLIAKRKVKTVYFSTLKFLKLKTYRSSHRLNLKNIFLLLIRVLIILIFCLALARPTLKSAAEIIGTQGRTSAVIILDNSYSMGYIQKTADSRQRTTFERAKEIATKIISSLRFGDKASLILLSNKVDVRFKRLTTNLPKVMEEIKRSTLSYGTTDILQGLIEADSILKESRDPNKEIYLLTDFQRIGWEGMKKRAERLKLHKDIKLFIFDLSEKEKENCAITDVLFSTNLIGKGMKIRITPKIQNIGERKEKIVELYIDGKKKAQRGVVLNKGLNTLDFFHTFRESGIRKGYIKISDDLLHVDNTYYFTLKVLDRINTLIISDDIHSTFYLKHALCPPGSSSIIHPVVSSGERDFYKYNVVILANVEGISKEGIVELENYVKAGGGLLISLGDKVDRSFYNQNLKNLIPCKVKGIINAKPHFTITDIDTTHPIFRIFKVSDWRSVSFFKAFDIEPNPGSKVLAKFGNGKPAIIEGRLRKGRIVLFTFQVDFSFSNLPIKPSFLPLMHQTIYYLNRSLLEQRSFLVGERGMNRPGIYRLDTEDGKKDYFSVNLDTKESDLSEISQNEIKNLLIGTKLIFITEPEDLKKIILKERLGKELGKLLIFAVLGLMFLEGILSNRWRKKK